MTVGFSDITVGFYITFFFFYFFFFYFFIFLFSIYKLKYKSALTFSNCFIALLIFNCIVQKFKGMWKEFIRIQPI